MLKNNVHLNRHCFVIARHDFETFISFLQKFSFLLLCYIPRYRMYNTCKNNDGLKLNVKEQLHLDVPHELILNKDKKNVDDKISLSEI